MRLSFDDADGNRETLTSDRSLKIKFVVAQGSGGQAEAHPPVVSGAPAVTGADSGGSWAEGGTVRVALVFSEAVDVDTSGGTPTIGVEPRRAGGTAKTATYESGSGTAALTFGYTLVAGRRRRAPTMGVAADSLATRRRRPSAPPADRRSTRRSPMSARPRSRAALARGPDPAVAFRDVPERHDGSAAFTVGLRFAGAPAGLVAKRDAARVIEVAGGSVTKGRQIEAGASPVWEVTVAPSGTGGVTLRVPARACDAAGAVCIAGAPLADAIEASVPGPALGASFTQAPAAHDGSSVFELGFAFDREPAGYSYKTVHKHLFDVTGGRIEKASRLVRRRRAISAGRSGWRRTAAAR